VFDIEQNYVAWRKSTRSGPNGGNCVEVAAVGNGVAVRDSKNPDGGHLEFSRAAWSMFVSALGGLNPENR
jgi:hypothetical protein